MTSSKKHDANPGDGDVLKEIGQVSEPVRSDKSTAQARKAAREAIDAFWEAERAYGHERRSASEMMFRIRELERALGPLPPYIERIKPHLQAIEGTEANFTGAFAEAAGLPNEALFEKRPPLFSPTQIERLHFLKSATEDFRNRAFRVFIHTPDHEMEAAVAAAINQFVIENPDNEYVESESSKGIIGSRSVADSFGEARVSDRPRWAEENRPGKRLSMRLSVDLLNAIDEVASRKNATRTDWITNVARHGLAQYAGTAPPDVPDFKTTRPVHIRLPESSTTR